MKRRLLTLLLCFASAAYGDAASDLAEAEKLNAEARALHNAWIPTARFIEEAKTALAAGDMAGAETAAARALKLAKASLHQAETEKEAW